MHLLFSHSQYSERKADILTPSKEVRVLRNLRSITALQTAQQVHTLTDVTSLQILKTHSYKIHFNIIHRPEFFHSSFQTETL
jgi:hypothetical protein